MSATTTESIPSMMYDTKRGWVERTEGHGLVDLVTYTRGEDYKAFGLANLEMMPTPVQVVANTGCQASLMGLDYLYKMGLKKKDLGRVRSNASSINGAAIDIILRLSGRDKVSSRTMEMAALVRVARGSGSSM